MIQFHLQILFHVVLVCGSHRFAKGNVRQNDIKSFSGNIRPNLIPTNNDSQSGLRIINGKPYFIQTFKPISVGSRNWKYTLLRKANLHRGEPGCKTPNNDTGHCVMMRDCPVLDRVKNKEENQRYLNDSICREDETDKRYCCGKYENFKSLLPKRPLPKSCGYQLINPLKNGKILGGTETKLGEFPWLARIIHTSNEGDKSFRCEGFLIHKRFILTAAHCVRSRRIVLAGNNTEIQLGEHNTQTEKDCNGSECADPLQTKKVKSIIPHPEYRHNSRDHHYDIALIYLKGSVKFSEYVQPICLLDRLNIPTDTDTKYWISGWGKTENGSYSDVKMKVLIPPFDIVECNKKYSKVRISVGESQLCAGGEENRDSCIGDSGGPLMLQNTERRWFAIGIVSYGRSCGLAGWPGVYTSIPYYYDWIVNKIIQLREPELLITSNLSVSNKHFLN